MMVVIVLMGMIASAVAWNVMKNKHDADIARTRIDMVTIGNALDVYRVRHNKLPESLAALAEELKRAPTDAWGNAYLYERTSSTRDGYRITSLGADGAPGGEGADADLHSDDPPGDAPPK
ncbi:MAG: type II secretion system protein GspG [Deltaproteobacteria bacterium]|nr:type II secretion system protein GspG [Deltaproteobacteria bacterium]